MENGSNSNRSPALRGTCSDALTCEKPVRNGLLRSAGRPTMHGKPFEFEQLALRGAPSDAWKAVRIRTARAPRGALRCMGSRSNSNSSRSAGRPTMHGKPFEFEQLALRGAPSDAWKAVRIRTVSHAPGGAPGDTPT